MKVVSICCFVFGFCALSHLVSSFTLIPERCQVIYVNETYFYKNVTAFVTRTHRGGDYIVNLEITLLKPVTRTVTLHLVAYEFLHNEYRQTFVQMHGNLCNFMEKDLLLGAHLRAYGLNKCPIPTGLLSIKGVKFVYPNWTNKLPFNKFKVNIQINNTVGKDEDFMAEADLYVHVKDETRIKYQKN